MSFDSARSDSGEENMQANIHQITASTVTCACGETFETGVYKNQS